MTREPAVAAVLCGSCRQNVPMMIYARNWAAQIKMDVETKRIEIVGKMKALRRRLETGDDSELLVWILMGHLACAHRPLRHHPLYGGSGSPIPKDATALVFEWAASLRTAGIRSIISFMHDRDLTCYHELDIGADDLLQFYEHQGFTVARIPWEDPAHSRTDHAAKQAREMPPSGP